MRGLNDITLVREMTKPLLMVSVFSSLGGMSFGLDNAYWGGLLGMKQFAKDFGTLDELTGEYSIPTTWQSAGSGTPLAGVALGCLLAAPLSARFGRKISFYVLNVIALVGIVLQASAFSYWQITVGRIINSISMGIICNVVPTYQNECAPAAIRGAAINFYQFWQLLGALLATIINYVCSNRTDQWAYRTVMVCQFAIPIILLIGAYFLPESPRWLLIKDRDTEAEKIMQWLRIGTHTEVVKEELHLIKLAIEQQRELHYAASYLDCFRGTNRRRTLIAAGVQCFQQFQGAQFILNYVYIFLAEIGVENTYQIGIYLYLVNLISAGCAFYMADKFGRRPILAVGALVMCASMFVVGGLAGVAGAKTSAQQNGALAALFVWLAFQAIAWGSCVWITCAEVGTAQLREKTITIATFLGFCSSILVTYVSPYLQNKGYGNLQGNIGFVWGGLSALSLAFVIFYVPELKGRSLEELDDMFQQKVSVFKFGKYRSVQGIGTIITQTEKKDAVLDKDAFSVEEKSVDPSVA